MYARTNFLTYKKRCCIVQCRMSNLTKDIVGNYKTLDDEKEEKIKQIVEEHSSQSELDEEESKHYSKFADEGTEAVKTMTGFFISEFLELYSLVEKNLKVQGRGKKPEIGPLDSFFFTLVMLKHYESWDKFSVTYKVKKLQLYWQLTER